MKDMKNEPSGPRASSLTALTACGPVKRSSKAFGRFDLEM
jgi:hypothetical protein